MQPEESQALPMHDGVIGKSNSYLGQIGNAVPPWTGKEELSHSDLDKNIFVGVAANNQ